MANEHIDCAAKMSTALDLSFQQMPINKLPPRFKQRLKMMYEQAALPKCLEIEVFNSQLIQMYWAREVWEVFDWIKKNIAEDKRYHIVKKNNVDVRRVDMGFLQQFMWEKHKHTLLKDLTKANIDDELVAIMLVTSWNAKRFLRLVSSPLDDQWPMLPSF